MDYIDITTDNIDRFLPEADQWIKDNISRGRFLAVGAEENESAAGAIVYTIRKADEADGNIGVLYYLSGDEAVMKMLLDDYALRVDGLDLQYTIVETADQKLLDLYTEYGFDMEESESIDLVFEVKDLDDIASFKSLKLPSAIRSLTQITPIEFRYFLQEYREKVNLNPYFEIEATPMNWYDPDVSCVYTNEDGIEAAFLVHYDGKSTVTAELLAGFGDDFKEMVTYLLAFSCECALFTYTPDTKVIVRRDGKQIAKICKNILGDKKGSKTYHGILMETEKKDYYEL